ncbi:MipA/OmpV family protein [Beggiatoa alba]|nr:MipA/OmpV family protein [Beggiatoa alba]
MRNKWQVSQQLKGFLLKVRQGRVRRVRSVMGLLCLLGLLQAPSVWAVHLPKWEIGLGAGILGIPAYRGAKGHETVVLPVPFVAYRGDRFKIDEEGLRGELLHRNRLQLDFSVAGSLPVPNGKGARDGMPGLDPVAEAGPSLKIVLGQNGNRRKEWEQEWWLRLPLRAALSVGDPLLGHQGWVFSPYLNWIWTKGKPRSLWRWSLSAGPIFASQAYHEYFYEVAPQFITNTRSAYEAEAGYGGSRVSLTLAVYSDRWFVGGFVRYDDLHGAVFDDSPLVETRSYLAAGIALSRVFARSDERVTHR